MVFQWLLSHFSQEHPPPSDVCLSPTVHRNQIRPRRRLYKCHICGKRQRSGAALERHNKAHQGIMSFFCARCSKGYEHSRDLDYHIRRHTDIWPYRCQICNKGFYTKNWLKRHNRTRGQRSNTCERIRKAAINAGKGELVRKETSDTADTTVIVRPLSAQDETTMRTRSRDKSDDDDEQLSSHYFDKRSHEQESTELFHLMNDAAAFISLVSKAVAGQYTYTERSDDYMEENVDLD